MPLEKKNNTFQNIILLKICEKLVGEFDLWWFQLGNGCICTVYSALWIPDWVIWKVILTVLSEFIFMKVNF